MKIENDASEQPCHAGHTNLKASVSCRGSSVNFAYVRFVVLCFMWPRIGGYFLLRLCFGFAPCKCELHRAIPIPTVIAFRSLRLIHQFFLFFRIRGGRALPLTESHITSGVEFENALDRLLGMMNGIDRELSS